LGKNPAVSTPAQSVGLRGKIAHKYKPAYFAAGGQIESFSFPAKAAETHVRARLLYNPMKSYSHSSANASNSACAKAAATTRATTSGETFSDVAIAKTNGVGLPPRVGR
jgi:hypothetical protein